MKNSATITEDGFHFGIRSTSEDYLEEENNTYSPDDGDSTSAAGNAVLYSCRDGNSSIVTDEDWYKYKGSFQAFSVDVNFAADAGFDSGDVKLQFAYYNGSPINISEDLSAGNNSIVFNHTDSSPPSTIHVYFRIYVNENTIDDSKDFVLPYSISIGSF